mmetsp:Transcript_78130/g.203573  ORF Transcript_78130/g.203573 Transcript_78130/m.203573 type:complete len:519 (+) Transcript_78130:2-1558(+)
MSEHALVPLSGARCESVQAVESPPEPCQEPLAEQIFGRKRLCHIEQGVDRLQRASREQQDAVSNLEAGLQERISKADLRREISLAFQELDRRVEDAILDSGRKCLALFSRKDDTLQLSERVDKKVSWAEHNAVLKRLSDLRLYVETMANETFVGHREALNAEFAKKADAEMVREALAAKAGCDEVRGLTERVERLEAAAREAGAQQAAAIEAGCAQLEAQIRGQLEKQQAALAESEAAIAALRSEVAQQARRLAAAEAETRQSSEASNKLKRALQALQDQYDEAVMPALKTMKEKLSKMDSVALKTTDDLMRLTAGSKSFQEVSQKSAEELSRQGTACKEQIEFLVQATDMIKRKARESTKSTTAKFAELADEDGRLREQLAALERGLKKQERDLRAAGRALPAPEPPPDPNERLVGVLQQLEAIAGGGNPQGSKNDLTVYPRQRDQAALMGGSKTERPPLPVPTGQTTPRGSDGDFALARLAAITGQTQIDSRRSYSSVESPRRSVAAGGGTARMTR